MPEHTENYELIKQLPEEFYDRTLDNQNLDLIDAQLKALQDIKANGTDLSALRTEVTTHLENYINHVPYVVDSGTANAKVVTLTPAPTDYVDGMAIAFKNGVENTGATTINVNGLGDKSIVRSNGNALSSGSLKANSVYTIRYNGTSFFLQGEGGEYGTATASQVLQGYTIGTENGVIEGVIENRTSVGGQYVVEDYSDIGVAPHTSGGNYLEVYTRPRATAYMGPFTLLTTFIPNLTVEKIQAGVTVGPSGGKQVTGTFTSDATATAAQILLGETAYVKGSKITGTATVSTLGGRKIAKGTLTNLTQYNTYTVNSLSFKPSLVIVSSYASGTRNGLIVYMTEYWGGNFEKAFSTDEDGEAWNSSDITPTDNGFTLRASQISNNQSVQWVAVE